MNVHDGDDLVLANYQSCFPAKYTQSNGIRNRILYATKKKNVVGQTMTR